ncbi:MAG TPA: carboxypeptidase-like regulatory domain-containing protein [Bacteroidales bacterium]|nr:carboxypeptidase-like regulatory domain-containing protein [Bacteroidales bacterium]
MIPLRKITFLTLIALSFSVESYTQEGVYIQIRGTVRESSGKPLENVAVTCETPKTGTYSDSTGVFVLKLPRDAASRIINFTLTGYEPLRITIVCDKDYSTGEIVLNEKAVTLNEITVTAVTEKTGAGMVSVPIRSSSSCRRQLTALKQ